MDSHYFPPDCTVPTAAVAAAEAGLAAAAGVGIGDRARIGRVDLVRLPAACTEDSAGSGREGPQTVSDPPRTG